MLDELRILGRTRRMPYPVDAERPNRAPHAGRSRGFAGMRRRPNTERARTLERGLEQLGRKAGLKPPMPMPITPASSPRPSARADCGVLDAAITHEIGDERNVD